MKIRKLVFSILIFNFVFMLPISNIIDAQRSEFLSWKQNAFAKISHLQQLEEQSKQNIETYAKKATSSIINTTKINTAKAIISDEDANRLGEQIAKSPMTGEECQADPACNELPSIGLNAPEVATLGDTIPVIIMADKAQNIAKVNLSIDDPISGKTFFKDSFVNIKKQESFLFTYNWDTFFAQTRPDAAGSSHKITAEFYSEIDGKFILIGRIIENTTINPFNGYDPLGDAFWSGYLKGDNSFNQAWKDKLGCTLDPGLCKDQEAVKAAFAQGVSNESITEQDITNINSTLSLYTTQLNKEAFVEDESHAKKLADWFNMSDLAALASESMNQKAGIPTTEMGDDFLKSPEKVTVAKILEEYSTKIASYNPQNPDEWKAMPFYNEMEKKIVSQISNDPGDLPYEAVETSPAAQENTISYNFFRVEKANATWFSLGLSVAFVCNDVYNLVKKPSWANAGWLALSVAATVADVFMLPGGEALAVGKIGAKILQVSGKIGKALPVLGRIANGARDIFGAIKGSEVVVKAFSKIKGLKEAYAGGKEALAAFISGNKYLTKILEKVGPLGSKVSGWFRGKVNKFLELGGKLVDFIKANPVLAARIFGPAVVAIVGALTECGAASLKGGPSPQGIAFQYTLCVFFDGMRDAIVRTLDYLFDIVSNYTQAQPIYMEAPNKPPSIHLDSNFITQSMGSLVFWKVDHAHASLSAALNPDPKITSNLGKPKVAFAITIWKTMRAFINIFLIFIIVFVAFANIFRFNIDKYAIKKALPGLILGVFLANFSALICCGILDIAEIFTKFVTNGSPATIWRDAIDGIWGVMLGLMFTGATAAGITAALVWSNPIGWGVAILAAFLIGAGIFLPLLLMFFALALRTGIMIVLFTISPVAFLCLGSPLTQGLFKKWWEEYIRWSFVPVVMFFIVWLATQVTKGV